MEDYVYWFLLSLLLIGVEMTTGTFYLLVLSIASAIGGFAAWIGMSSAVQLTLCAIGAMFGILLLRRWKSLQIPQNSSDSMDVGQVVKVLHWREDGSARVLYRGAEWDAELEFSEMPRDEALYIVAVRGARLILVNRKSQH
jgi:membrane protein implicated in regulation of membrane protease activity